MKRSCKPLTFSLGFGKCSPLSKGQAALEYMIIVSISLILITPLIVNSQDTVNAISNTRRKALLNDAMDSIEKGANMIKSQGEPARITFNVDIPVGVVSSNITGKYIHYRLDSGDGSDYYRFFDFNVTGSLPEESGVHSISIKNYEEGVNVTYE